MKNLNRQSFSKAGEILFLLGFVLFFLSTVTYTDSIANRLSMIAVILMILCLLMLAIGGEGLYIPAVGFLGRKILDEREIRASAKATQISTYVLLIYIFLFSWFIPNHLTVNQALIGAFYLVIVVSGAAYQILLQTASNK